MASVVAPTQWTSVESLYREDGDRLWKAIFIFAGDPDIASDAVAEAFAQALRRGDAIRNMRAWIWSASFRIAAGELSKRGSSWLIPDAGYTDAIVDHELLEAVAELPVGQREAVVLFYYVDSSVRDIAALTGRSQIAVRANLSRGRKTLKQILGARDD
jgi:RNA polymerase sigma-70 factor (ECF subfamily)